MAAGLFPLSTDEQVADFEQRQRQSAAGAPSMQAKLLALEAAIEKVRRQVTSRLEVTFKTAELPLELAPSAPPHACTGDEGTAWTCVASVDAELLGSGAVVDDTCRSSAARPPPP